MKRIVAFVFLIGLSALILFGLSTPNVQYELLEKVCFVTSEQINLPEESVVKNGNQSYITVSTDKAGSVLEQLTQIDGYVLYFSPETGLNYLLNQFFDYKNTPYSLAGYEIFDGYTSKYADYRLINGKKYNVQLAVTPDAIIVGFPMILTGF